MFASCCVSLIDVLFFYLDDYKVLGQHLMVKNVAVGNSNSGIVWHFVINYDQECY